MQLDVILENLNGLTMDPSRPRVEAIGILGDRIVAAGPAHELADLRATTRLDLDGATVVPGFNDAHNHMGFFGATLNEVDLTPAAVGSVEEVVTDEVRYGPDLDVSLAQYQRMYDELQRSGGTVAVEGAVTVARQVIATPDGAAEDVWRIGRGDPQW